LTPTSSPTMQPFTPSAFSNSSLDSPTPFPTYTPTLTTTLPTTLPFTSTFTLPPPPTNCSPPVGWLAYFVQPGETLDSIAERDRISSAELQNANCLSTTELIPGVVVFVPPMRTQTPLLCGAPYSWIVYYVQPGDTLYRMGTAYGITVAELQRANCMGTSTLLHTGQMLKVPPWAPLAPLQTVPNEVIPTCTLTGTLVPCSCSDTPTELPNNTAAEIPSATEVPTATQVPTTP
jgi:LysM repeat protein